MKRRAGQFMGFGLLAGIAGTVGWPGCESAPGYLHTGIAAEPTGALPAEHPPELRIGKTVPDFTVIDELRQPRRFKDIRGRITVVAFPEGRDWTNLAGLQQLRRDVDDVAPSDIEIVLIVVGSPTGPCEEALATLRAELAEIPNMFVVCDPSGAIRALYGPDAKGRFFVVDNLGKLAAAGDFSARRTLQYRVAEAVDELRKYDIFFITN